MLTYLWKRALIRMEMNRFTRIQIFLCELEPIHSQVCSRQSNCTDRQGKIGNQRLSPSKELECPLKIPTQRSPETSTHVSARLAHPTEKASVPTTLLLFQASHFVFRPCLGPPLLDQFGSLLLQDSRSVLEPSVILSGRARRERR